MSELTALKDRLKAAVDFKEGICNVCKEPISNKNTFTPDGWAEAKISNTCEECFDSMFDGDEDEGDGFIASMAAVHENDTDLYRALGMYE